MAEATETANASAEIPGLRIVRPDDIPTLANILSQSWRMKELWNDANLQNPGPWFMSQYANHNNLVFDVEDGAGVIAFLYTQPSYRTSVWLAAWERRAMRSMHKWKQAGRVMMLMNDLLVIDAFVRSDNTLSRRAALSAGMTYRGRIRNGTCYNGHVFPLDWFEIDRAALGLDPLTAEVT